jgi:hypothetical protein
MTYPQPIFYVMAMVDVTDGNSKSVSEVQAIVNKIKAKQGIVVEETDTPPPQPNGLSADERAELEALRQRVALEELRKRVAAEAAAEEAAEQAADQHVDKNEYSVVENYAIDHPDIGGRELAVYTVLARRCFMPKKTCTASISGLSIRLGWDRKTVSGAIDKLINVGLIERGHREPGGAYVYTLPHRHKSKPKQKRAKPA